MLELLLALALAAPADGAPAAARRLGDAACFVSVAAVDVEGRVRSTRQVSAALVPALVFRGRVPPGLGGTSPLLFDVFNPKGQRYQVLVPARRGRAFALQGSPRLARTVEARLAVAGSSIAWTSMFGLWRVEPRFEGQESPCGPPQAFTILP
jgi:hypothetical protein